MSDERKDGGAAFPREDYQGDFQRGQCGMSLRDYFAAKAMHAELMTCGVPGGACDALVEAAEKYGRGIAEQMAVNAYEVADAMLRARQS